jgi:hypothetical protein
MAERAPDDPAVPRRTVKEIVADHDLLRLARFDVERFLTLVDFEQRLMLKMAEQLVNADRRAAPDGADDQAG